MSDVLVVYYSLTGHTEAVARVLADRLGADLEAVRPMGSYAGALGALRGMWQQLTGTGPTLQAGLAPEGYKLVVVGSPVWGGRLAAPVRSYLQRNRGRFQRLAGFWVSRSGQAYPYVAREMARLTGETPRATLALNDAEVKSGAFAEKAAGFAGSLSQAEVG